jgi:hypothetical protein
LSSGAVQDQAAPPESASAQAKASNTAQAGLAVVPTASETLGSPVSTALPSSQALDQADQTQQAFGLRSNADKASVQDPLGGVNPTPQAMQAGGKPLASAAAGSGSRTTRIAAASSAVPLPQGTATALESSLSGGEASVSSPAQVQPIAPQPATIPGQIAAPIADQIHSPAQSDGQTAEQRTTAVSPVAGNQGVASGKTAVTSSDAAPPELERSSTAVTSRSSEPVASRNAQAQEASHAVVHGLQASQPQIAGAGGDASSLVRDPAAQNASQDTSSTAETGSAAIAAHETFATIDTGASSDTSSWTHIGAHRAEAGIQDPTLGWIGVRADGSAGQVHATLIPGSTDAAQALGGHLAGLNAYLADTYTPVQSIHIAQPEGREAASSSSQDQGQGMGQSSGQSSNQGMNQNANQDGSSQSPRNLQPVMSAHPATDRIQAQVSTGSFGQPPGTTEFSGAHISVVA